MVIVVLILDTTSKDGNRVFIQIDVDEMKNDNIPRNDNGDLAGFFLLSVVIMVIG